MKTTPNVHPNGFTIVELLIVIVVIAILAAITIVSYNGITASAHEAVLKSDLSSNAGKIQIAKASTGQFPSNSDNLSASGDNELTYSYNSAANTFCLAVVSPNLPGKSFFTTQDGNVEEGECAYSGIVSGDPIANMNPTHCSNLTVYDGTNDSAILTLRDNRGGINRDYRVAKLADQECWMLDNLKLGSTAGAITLTPADSDVTANFSLPQVRSTGSAVNDSARAYGPVPGDTGTGAGNYGYLYNWTAATAGATRTSAPVYSGKYAHSICPTGWGMPTGSATSGNEAYGKYARLNARMVNPDATSGSTSSSSTYRKNWQQTGPFKGVMGGQYEGYFSSTGTVGYFWSATASTTTENNAGAVMLTAGSVDTVYSFGRERGAAVRCIAD